MPGFEGAMVSAVSSISDSKPTVEEQEMPAFDLDISKIESDGELAGRALRDFTEYKEIEMEEPTVQESTKLEKKLGIEAVHSNTKPLSIKDCSSVSRVLVIYTGGTIGMKTQKDGVYAPEVGFLPKVLLNTPRMNDCDFDREQYRDDERPSCVLPFVSGMTKRVIYWIEEYEPLLDSSDMSSDDWIRIAKDIEKNYNDYDAFVILHGTDTLAFTASALSFMLENLGKPVVVTGSMIPLADVRSDGLDNIIGALIVAGSFTLPEVLVWFHNNLLRGNRVTKMNNLSLDAFSSPNETPLATMGITFQGCLVDFQ